MRKRVEQSSDQDKSKERILEILRLHAVIREVSREINSTYSSISSAVIFPVIFKMIFLADTSYFQDYLFYLFPLTSNSKDRLRDFISHLDSKVSDGENVDFYKELVRFYNHKSPYLKKLFEKFDFYDPDFMERAKQKCLSAFDAESDELLLQECQAIGYKKFKGWQMIATIKKHMLNGDWSKHFELEFDYTLNLPKVFAVLVGKRFVMDPIMQRFLSNGAEPLPKFLEYKSDAELKQIHDILKKTQIQLKVPAKRAQNLSISMLFAFLILLIIEKSLNTKLPDVVSLTFLCFTLSGALNLLSLAKTKYYDEKDYKITLFNNLQACKGLFGQEYTDSMVSQDFFNLRNSRIWITLKKYDELSSNQVCGVVVRVLRANNIDPSDVLGNTFRLFGSTVLSASKIAKIRNEIIADLNLKKEKLQTKILQPLNKDLWIEEIEPKAKTRNVKHDRTIPVAQHKFDVTPADKPSTVEWRNAKKGQTAVIINSVKGNQFTLFKLERADFPNDACYEKFKTIITTDPKVVRCVGQQGLVATKKYNGSLKAKALGEFGNVRIYASEKEVAGTGETRYVFDTLVLKAH